MPDAFLYPGEPNPSDVRLRDPTTSGAQSISGSAALTQQPQTHSASGSLQFDSNAALIEQPATTSASGTETFSASAALAQQPQSVAGSGSEIFSAASGLGQSSQSISAQASLVFSGTSGLIQTPATITASGAEQFSGAATLTQQAQTITETGLEDFDGSAGLTQSPATCAGAGSLVFAGTGSLIATAEIGNGSGTITFSGDAVGSQGSQTILAVGLVLPPSSLPPDIFAIGDLQASPAIMTGTGDAGGETPSWPPGGSTSHLFRQFFLAHRPDQPSPPSPVTGMASLTAKPARMSSRGNLIPKRTQTIRRTKQKAGKVPIVKQVKKKTVVGTARMTAAQHECKAMGSFEDVELEQAILLLLDCDL